LGILKCWIANNEKYAMCEMRLNIYISMCCENFWGVGVAYIRELCTSLKNKLQT
jgi:hypothetical protein